MTVKTKKPITDYIEATIEDLKGDEEAQIAYLQASFEENYDMPAAILLAIRMVAKARGFKNFAEEADLNRENLYKSLSDGGNPILDTFFKLLDALKLKLTVTPIVPLKKKAS